MVAKQVIFRDIFGDVSLPIGGIAIYENSFDPPFLELRGVICGECGAWLEADDVEIISTLEQWWTLDEAIKNNIAPDGTRGFRPDNQISMKFD